MTLADRLKATWIDALRVASVRDIRDTDSFVGLGGDSIAAMTCLRHVSLQFNIEVPVTALLGEDADFRTFVSEVDSLISSIASLPADSPLRWEHSDV